MTIAGVVGVGSLEEREWRLSFLVRRGGGKKRNDEPDEDGQSVK